MTLVLASLVVLAVGAAGSLLLMRAPRPALNLSMLLAFFAAVLVVVAASDVLLHSSPQDLYEAAWPLSLGTARLSLDGLSAWFLMTIGVLAACVAIYSVPYMSTSVGREPVPVFCALFCGLLGSLILLVCAADAVLFLISWETMTLTAFLLVAFHQDRPEARRGAWMYLVATHMGTALFVLPLFGILFARSGTTAFSSFASAVDSGDDATLVALFVLGLMGFGTKAGFMPMHVWLPAAHPVAPTPVSALLSGVVVKTGIYGLLRLLSWLPPLPLLCGEILLFVGVVSGVMGVLYALAQHDLKRLLAYHTVENIGIIALGIAVGLMGEAANEPTLAVLGYAGALLHVANHALFKGLLFLSAGTVLHESGTGEIERLGGLARKMPVNALMFLIGAVAICGLPPLNGFLSEWMVYGSLFGSSMRGIGASGGLPAVGVSALALMGGLALACFAKVFGVVFLGEPRDGSVQTHATPAGMKSAMAILSLLCILIGVLPSLWVPLVRSATGELANVPVGEISAKFEEALTPATRLSGIAVVFAITVVGLIVLRRWALSRAARRDVGVVPTIATWVCGYAQPTPRMQYTASSFAYFLVSTFRGLLWPERTLLGPPGSFPASAHVETHAPDIAEKEFFEPIFRGAARLFAMVRTVSWRGEQESWDATLAEAAHRRGPVRILTTRMVCSLRRGSIQIRLLFVVLTLVVLFLFEAISSVGRVNTTPRQEKQHSLSLGVDR